MTRDFGPFVSDSNTKVLTMTEFAQGVVAHETDKAWITDEAAVKAEGAWWRDFRYQSIDFAHDHPEITFPDYKTIDGGNLAHLTPLDIEMTPYNYGVIHSDAHSGNFMLHNEDGVYT